MPSHHALNWAGEELWLLPERAVWWPSRGLLLVADLHLGKAATFRALGQPVPAGTTAANLARLDALLAAYPATQLTFLGDFLHAPEARTQTVLAAVRQWREAHAVLEVVLVRGNHDLRAGDPPPSLGIRVVDEPWPLDEPGAWLACHHPQVLPGRRVLAGHWHPAVSLQGPGRDRLRLPCFCLDRPGGGEAGLLVLPAFGEFTGAASLPMSPGRQFFVPVQDTVLPLP
ncbi:MAG TPA: ligase-associated DNA damage response endonuclease PdeM [Ideonella sp.]|uniref:ligase-associated DNA damage response endonuclease PdeM n=1 Tax=Ideonella sp. TaxID=1929293 RepID=UPI002C38AF70|nr:ligase-associated DNA damage response endonuclease PdeM [Ideonella sp.]HSI51835.1 ligase-associated DNA damage response endonuclease PdeM [Ideonella sp.]